MKEKTVPAKIIDAINAEDLDCLQDLIRKNPDQIRWNTPFAGATWLGYAASKGKLDTMKLLVKLGADVNQGDHREGVKPICSAACNDQFEAVQYLVTAGSVLDTVLSVQNPLFSAIIGRSPRITKFLLESRMDSTIKYDSKTMKNMDAIAFALMRGEKECARIIADWNAGGDTVLADQLITEADEIAKMNAYGRR